MPAKRNGKALKVVLLGSYPSNDLADEIWKAHCKATKI
jgi:hypothetical protein